MEEKMKTKRTKRTVLTLLIALTMTLCITGTGLMTFAESATTVTPLQLVEAGAGTPAPTIVKDIEFYSPAYNNRLDCANNTAHTYSGLKLPLSESNASKYLFKGTFKNDFSFKFLTDGDGTNRHQNSDLFFIFGDSNGNELFRIGRTVTNWNQAQSAAAYVRYTDSETGNKRYSTFGYKDNWVTYYPWEATYYWGYENCTPDVSNTVYPDGANYGLAYGEGESSSQTWGDMFMFPFVCAKNTDGNKMQYPCTVKISFGTKPDSVCETMTGLNEADTLFITMEGLNPYNTANGYQNWTIAQIDCSGNKNQAIKNAVQNGFTFSVCGDRSVHSGVPYDVIITELNNQSLAADSVAVTEGSGVRVHYDGEYEIGGKKYIDTVVGQDLGKFAKEQEMVVVADKWTYYTPVEAVSATGFDNTKTGWQKLTVEGSEYNVFVAPQYDGLKLVSDGARIERDFVCNDTPIKGVGSSHNYSGIVLPFDDAAKPSKYDIKGVFKPEYDGNKFVINYVYSSSNNRNFDGDTVFVFSDKSGKELFRVGRYIYGVWGPEVFGTGCAYLLYGGNTQYEKEEYPGRTPWAYLTVDENYNNASSGYKEDYNNPELRMISTRAGDLIVKIEGEKVVVSTSALDNTWELDMSKNPIKEMKVGEISDAAIVAAVKEGFTVSVQRTERTQQNVMLIAINGKALVDNDAINGNNVSLVGFDYDGYQSQNGDTIYVPQNGTVGSTIATAALQVADGWTVYEEATAKIMNGETEIEAGSAAATVGNNSVKLTAEICGHNFEQTVNYAVEASRKLVYNTNGGTAFDPVWISENTDGFDLPEPSKIGGLHFDGWYSDEGLTNAVTKATYAAGEGDINVYAKWLDIEPPVISLKDGIEELVLLEQAKGGSIATAVNKTDVVAEDRAMGVLTDGAITISVKEPNGSDFVAWGDWTFDAELYGNYTIKYTATDGTNSVSTERVIRYIKALPSITLSSEKPTSGWVNYEIALPAGASESGTVTVSVVLSGTPVTLTNGKFTPAAAGTYTVNYYVEDEFGYAANEMFDIVVIKDEVKPVITVDFTAKSVDLGTEFALPTATATDNVDGAVNVTVTVTFHGTEVTVTDGKFTCASEGVYIVTYTATDLTGNKANVYFELASVEAAKSGGCKGAVDGGHLIAAIIALTAATAIVFMKKRKN